MAKSAMNYNRVLVIGDIHGEFTKLKSLYDKVRVTDKDLVIFLGDYVDKGQENVPVLKWLMNENKKDNVIALCGNHEDMLNTDIVAEMFSKDSPKRTLREIALEKEQDKKFDYRLWEFLKGLPYYYKMNIKGQEYFFCHAGVNSEDSLDDQYEVDLMWIRAKFFAVYEGKTKIVAGHTPVMYLKTEEEINQIIQEYREQPGNGKKSLMQIVEELTGGNDNEDIEDIIKDKANPFLRSGKEAAAIKNDKPQWRNNGSILMMDTGSGMPNGCISCMDILSGKVWQSE